MGDTHVVESETARLEEDEHWLLSGKPYFHTVLLKTHIIPGNQMFLPKKLLQDLPPGRRRIPAVLTYRQKRWNLWYSSFGTRHVFSTGWKAFVVDNDLKVGDACIFELLKCSTSEFKFRVQILRGDFPSELLGVEDGETQETAIIID